MDTDLFYLLVLLPLAHGQQGAEISTNSTLHPLQYCIEIEGSIRTAAESDAEVARKISAIVNELLTSQNKRELENSGASSNARVEIVRRVDRRNATIIRFIVLRNEKPLAEDTIAVSFMFSSFTMNSLKYFVAQDIADEERPSPWWIIAVVIGSGVLILCVGWCLLFIYLNLCGAQRTLYEISKTVYQSDDATQCDFPPLKPQENTSYSYEKQQRQNDKERELEETVLATASTAHAEPPSLVSVLNDELDVDSGDNQHVPLSPDSRMDSAEKNLRDAIEHEDTKDEILYSVIDQYGSDKDATRWQESDIRIERQPQHRVSRPKAAARPRKKGNIDKSKAPYSDPRNILHLDDTVDPVSTVFSIDAITFRHPRPRSPTENGVLQTNLGRLSDNTLSVL
ncbi:unnamed protein product [Cylicocyclus nassatus]|uniref:Uncharacterized protein n=1 Tax=Cylicocyclus nassatus TaxID=53992 RepID=A0AA36MI19_CYLNA|nr:unnamed protein product [Cylicocyclus nassatus]